MSPSSPAHSQHHCVHYMTTVKGWAQLNAVELRSFQGSCSSLVPGVLLQAESIFAKLKLDVEPFELDSLAALSSYSQSPLSAFSQTLIAERKSNAFCNAFSTGLLLHKIQYTQLSLSYACCVLWYFQCPDRWCPALISETLQMVCSVLLGEKLLWLVVVGAVPKSNPSLYFLGYFCLGTSLTVQGWKQLPLLRTLWLKFTLLWIWASTDISMFWCWCWASQFIDEHVAWGLQVLNVLTMPCTNSSAPLQKPPV